MSDFGWTSGWGSSRVMLKSPKRLLQVERLCSLGRLGKIIIEASLTCHGRRAALHVAADRCAHLGPTDQRRAA